MEKIQEDILVAMELILWQYSILLNQDKQAMKKYDQMAMKYNIQR